MKKNSFNSYLKLIIIIFINYPIVKELLKKFKFTIIQKIFNFIKIEDKFTFGFKSFLILWTLFLINFTGDSKIYIRGYFESDDPVENIYNSPEYKEAYREIDI